MGYTKIEARVLDQAIQLVNVPLLASGGVNEIEVEFTFCNLWDDAGKVAIFYRDLAQVYQVPVAGGKAVVPHEVTAERGVFYMSVFGAVNDQIRTADVVQFDLEQGAVTTGVNAPTPTPDLYQQILDAYGFAFPKNGSEPMTGILNMNGNRITNVGNPAGSSDVVTMGFFNAMTRGMPCLDLLWTNPNPSAAFGPGTVDVDLADYDLLMVVARENSALDDDGLARTETVSFCRPKLKGRIHTEYNAKWIRNYRWLEDNSGIEFSAGTVAAFNGQLTTDNNCAIPVVIYGVWGIGGA